MSRSSTFLLYTTKTTGSRGDVFVVRTSKPVEKWVILIGFQFRYTFGRPSVDVLCASEDIYSLRLLIFKMANNKVDLGQGRSEEIVYSRFIKIPLGYLIVPSDKYRQLYRHFPR